jgi:hypothetical protein
MSFGVAGEIVRGVGAGVDRALTGMRDGERRIADINLDE